jgi:hypothetical protein
MADDQDDKTVLICCRVADIDPPVASIVDCCGRCGKAVWRALSSPDDVDMVLCMQCAEAEVRARQAAGEPIEFGGITDKQRKEFEQWLRITRSATRR